MDFQAIRKEYENQGIDESKLPSEPFSVFKQWYELAVEKCPGPWYEPNAMAFATADSSGLVTNRYVLMKNFSEQGISFFTNYDSTKGTQLEENPQVGVAFHWPYLGRQIRITGSVEKTSREVSEEYFHSRPRGSQIGAAASKQSSKVRTREELDQARTVLAAKYEGQPIPLPSNWGGYLIHPDKIEFWQGRLDRLHDRIEYQRSTDTRVDAWQVVRLSP